jgi:hypothetical protein
MSEQVGSRMKRSPWLWVAVVAVGLGAAARLAGTLISGTDLWPVVVGVGSGLVIVVLVYAGVAASVRALLRRVTTQRPTATVVLTVPATSMVGTAARLGVDNRVIKADGSKYVALAILPDRVELWAGKSTGPHWWVPRTRDGVTLVHTRIGRVTMDALRIAASGAHEQEIVVRPVPLPIWRDFRRGHRQAAMEQLVRDLGHDPARVLSSAP